MTSVYLRAKPIFNNINKRSFCASTHVLAKRNVHPFDGRFDTNPKDIAPTNINKSGSRKLLNYLRRRSISEQQPGYYDKKNKFHLVPEMIPEFVVPDLTDFKLKPYVSYRVTDVTQTEFTARDLFNACYRDRIEEQYRKGKLDIDKSLPPPPK